MKTNIREEQEWITLRWHDTDDAAGLPRLLLIGDSIVNGHVGLLNEALQGKYAVDAFTTSKIVSDQEYMADLEIMLQKRCYDVIIFNNGLHGIKVDDANYAEELREVLTALQRYTNKLIWRNSTPCYSYPDGRSNPWSTRVIKRNALARGIVEELNIPAIDCYRVLQNRPDLVVDGIHFRLEGYQVIVEVIVDFLIQEKLLLS